MTYLCVSIMVDSVEQALADAAVAAERGADLVEYRVDTLVERDPAADELLQALARSPLPCVVTCRPDWEGGDYHGDELARRAFLTRLCDAGLGRYVDVELAAITSKPDPFHAPANGRVICSSHDFDGRPADLTRRVAAMAHEPACGVMKLAWRARSLRDNLEAFELLRERVKPMIALCMGEFGLPSRVLARKFGAFLTFVGLDDKAVTAPGQVGVETIKSLYRWDSIDRDTLVYGVVGWPVGHSMSPAIMNAGFDATGHDGVYLPLPVPPEYEHFKATIGSWLDFAPLDFSGASVTIPHKENLLRFVAERGGEIEPLAARIGAANTLVVRDGGTLYAANTDYAAAIDAVCDAMGIERAALAGKRVAVIGAGGAARAVVAAFTHHGAHVTVYNRTADRAASLAESFRAAAASLDDLAGAAADILVNCTPVGMHPNVDASPLPVWPASLGPGAVVFDTIYNPVETKLLRDARSHGCTAVPGVEMFVRQAARQFELWTGRPAPVEVFDRIVRQRLA